MYLYPTKVTQKGQIILKEPARQMLGIVPGSIVLVKTDPKSSSVSITKAVDIRDISQLIHPRHRKSPLLARQRLEKEYERI